MLKSFLATVLLSASVKRFFVSLMRDFYLIRLKVLCNIKNLKSTKGTLLISQRVQIEALMVKKKDICIFVYIYIMCNVSRLMCHN